MTAVAALLTLADSRLPVGGHAHSGGVEQAISDRFVTDAATLADFLDRRLHTVAPVSAALAAAACHATAGHAIPAPTIPAPTIAGNAVTAHPIAAAYGPGDAGRLADRLAGLDAEADARMPAPAVRAASRVLGRGLARLGRRAWPNPAWAELPVAPHHPIALGVAAASAGLSPVAAAQVAAYLSISGPASAAARLLSLDPLIVAGLTADLCTSIDAVAEQASRDPAGPLNAVSDPWFDLLAETHASRKDRLFAS
jgi:urease accessory protein